MPIQAMATKTKIKGPIETWTDLINDLIDRILLGCNLTEILNELPKEDIQRILVNLAKSRKFDLTFPLFKGKYIIWLEPIP